MLTVSSFHDDDNDDDHNEKDSDGDTQTDIHSNILVVLSFMGFWKEKKWSDDYAHSLIISVFEPVHEKTNNLGFQPGPTQTSLYSHRRNIES